MRALAGWFAVLAGWFRDWLARLDGGGPPPTPPSPG